MFLHRHAYVSPCFGGLSNSNLWQDVPTIRRNYWRKRMHVSRAFTCMSLSRLLISCTISVYLLCKPSSLVPLTCCFPMFAVVVGFSNFNSNQLKRRSKDSAIFAIISIIDTYLQNSMNNSYANFAACPPCVAASCEVSIENNTKRLKPLSL